MSMPVQDSLDTFVNVPIDVSQQTRPINQEVTPLTSSHDAQLGFDSRLLGDSVPTPFPSVTGLKPWKKIGEAASVTIDSGVTFADLGNAAASLYASPIAALQATWAVILSAYTAIQDDVIFKTLLASPASYDSDCLVENTSHVVPTRVCLDGPKLRGQTDVGSVMRHLTESNASAVRQLKEPTNTAAQHARPSKHGTVIALKGKKCAEDDDIVLKSGNVLFEGEEYAVSILVWPDVAGALKLEASYIDLVLNEASALVMLQQFDDVLAFILTNPAKPIKTSLTAIRPSLLSISNEDSERSTFSGPQAQHLHSQFENHATHSPDRPALDFTKDITSEKSSSNTTWTYEYLNDRADMFATLLIHHFGQLTDKVIPICMERCPELYVAILGILKTGGAWCPIDPSFPTRRRHDLIARTCAQMVVVSEQKPANITESMPEGVSMVDITSLDTIDADLARIASAKIGSLAYLIWTSGTTGDPKGVPIHHDAAVTSMRALQRGIPTDVTGGSVRCLQFSQFTFDVFVQDLFYTWGVGGTVIASTREIMLGSFAELATKTNATHAHLTPAFAASVSRERCPTLQVITMIGERLPQAIADDWSQDIRAFNTYGPAETTVVSTFRQFGAAGDSIRSDNIGFPLASVSAFVMRDGLPLPRQGIGELALGGSQLSRGYWKDSERSSDKFIWNQHYSRDLYMTGDFVRQLHDGSLEFVGRTDDLIKIQGIRVELSEIGFSLRSCHPLIGRVEVQYLSREDRPSKVIVAFLAAPKLDNTREVTSHLIASEEAIVIARSAVIEAQKALAAYMIPGVFLVINDIPRTSSAKIDKAVLQNCYSSIDLTRWETRLALNDNKVNKQATWTTRESELIAIIAEISGTSRDSMGRVSDLRSIGVDSIAAIRLAPILNAKGFSLSVADVFKCQNLDDLLRMSDKPRTMHPTELFDLEGFHKEWYARISKTIKRNDVFVAPALPLQESLLSESMQNAGAYWSHISLILDHQIDTVRLHAAWLQVVSDTEALRTGFIPSTAVLENGDNKSLSSTTFIQLIYEEASIDWACMKSSEANMKNLATERAHAVAMSHQRKQYRDPLLTVTIFESPIQCIIMISVHHAVRDAASLEFILKDVNESYQRPGERPKHRHRLREALRVVLPTKSRVDEVEIFWSKALDGFSTTDGAGTWPDLTGRGTRIEESTPGFITHVRALETSCKSLQEAAIALGASSVASIFRVAWGSVLLEYLEIDSVVFAETCSDRFDDFTMADIVGPLTTVLPVPFRASGSAREVLVTGSKLHGESRAHRSIHSRVVRKLLNRSENQTLYPAVFNFLPDLGNNSQNSCSSIWKKLDNVLGLTVEHPLALNVVQVANDVLEMEIVASQTVMSTTHLAILACQVDSIVETMTRLPDMPLTQLSSYFPIDLLSKTSVAFSGNVIDAWKQNPTDWVDHHAEVHPHWLAAKVVDSFDNEESESGSWNFAELRSAYDRIAAFISHSGYVGRMIAVCMDRRIEAYAIILGILASGNTYLPIDEDLPGERKSLLLKDSAAAMLFTISSLASTFPSTLLDICVVYVDSSEYSEEMAKVHAVELPSHLQAGDNAYLLYTSGSTGVPKGVLVGRGNLCSFIEGLSEFICPLIPGMEELPGKGRYLGLASRAFDVHIAEMFLAWRQGLAAVTAPRTMLLDNLELALRKLKITHASFVPSLIDQAGLDPANLPDLHYLGVGGEKMSKRVIDTWVSNDNVALINAYGPTEMSIGCTAAEVTRESNLRNVGRPYGNSVAHVLVPGSDRYTLRGVAGELCFTGDLVANGYHNRPDAKGFVDDFNGERMYRTGDIVRLMADDTVEYLRREDDQTKVRGQRLELGEISEAIRSSAIETLGLAKIDVATVIAQHPKLSRPQLVSFVVVSSFTNKNAESQTVRSDSDKTIASRLQTECQKALPAYMVPDVVIPLTKLPLAPSSGKADLKRLQILFANIPIAEIIQPKLSGKPHQQEISCQELTEAERSVQSVIMTTLAIDGAEVFANTNLFRLGLDSLSAISLAVRMQRLGYDCTVSSVLSKPFLEQLALLPLKDQNNGVRADRLTQTRSKLAALASRFRAIHSPSLGGSSIQAVKPCLPLQETLVATSLDNKSGALYVNHVKLRLSTEINCARLCRAWRMLVADHAILRTCFQEFENGIVQIVLKHDRCGSSIWEDTAVSNLETSSQLQQSKSAREIISEIASKPPIRLSLLRPPSDDKSAILSISIHHALYDRESIAMVLEELNMQYHSAVPSAHTPFDAMIEHVCSQDQEASRAFWSEYLAHYESTSIVDGAIVNDEHQSSNVFSTVDRTLACPLTELEEFSSFTNGTLTSTIQAVFGVILAQTLGIHDVVFGVVLSGRTVPIEDPHTIVAPCITTIPQRVNLGNIYATVVDIVKVAQQGFVESLEFQHTALRNIHRWVGAKRPLFDCLISYIQKRVPKPRSYQPPWTELEDSMPNEFPLSLEFEADHEANRIHVHCVYSTAFGDLDRATSLLENMDLLLGALVRREDITTENLGIANSDSVKSEPKLQVWDESLWSPRELEMRELAAEICEISAKDISKGASFFSLGIDSITAIRFAQGLRQLGMRSSSADVMRHPCIAALAHKVGTLPSRDKSVETRVEQLQEDALKGLMPEIPILSPRDTVTDLYPCTPLQSSMLTQTLGSEGRFYSHHHAIQLAPHIDLARLKRALGRLKMETEMLRTTFHSSRAVKLWLGAVHQDIPDAWTERNICTSISDSLMEIAKHSAFLEEADFERPPWKATVLKTGPEIVVVFSIHHSLYDGISISLLFQDLANLYRGIDLKSRMPFSDAARVISKNKTDTELFWLQRLDGFEPNEAPPSQVLTENEMIEVETTFQMDIKSILRGCKDLGVTIQTAALLAFGKSLACISGRRDVVFGHVVGGRLIAMPGVDEVIGPLFNTVPSRIVFDKTYLTNKSAALEIQQSSGDSQPYQHAPLGKIQQAWRQKVGNADAQLFDTLFVFQNSANKASSTGELWTSLDIGGSVALTEYATNFEFEQGEEEIILRVASHKGLRTREQLQVWLTHFEQIFQDILEHPQRSVMAFPSSFQSLPLVIRSNTSRPSLQSKTESGPDLDTIRAALSEISGLSVVDISTNASIFSLGLDSISAIQVAAICRKHGYGVSVADVLQGLSPGGICRRLREKKPQRTNHMENQSELISAEVRSNALLFANVKSEDVEDIFPCLAGQLYHLACWLKSDRKMCEAIWLYCCSKRLNMDDLKFTWRRLRERHSVLRTIFVGVSPKEALQLVLKSSALNDDSFQCTTVPVNSIDGVLAQVKEVARQPFDLFSPPSKLYLIRGETQDYVLLKLHHVTYDAWTLQTIIDDLAALYHNIHLPSPPPFKSFIHHTKHNLHTKAEKLYWRKSLENCQQTLLQPSMTQTKNQSPISTTSTIFTTIPSALPNLQTLETACRTSSISLPTLILLAFSRALARLTPTTNPTFGVYQAGRSASFANINQLCAPCLNVTPITIPDALGKPLSESVQRLQSDLAERVDFEQSFWHEIGEWVGGGGELMFNTFVNILADYRRGGVVSAPSSMGTSIGSEPLFVPCELDNALLDLAPVEGPECGETAVDTLDTGWLAEKNLYLDVVRRVERDCVDFAIRCDRELMDEEMVRVFAGEVAGEVEMIVDAVGRDGVGEFGREGEKMEL